MDAIVVGIDVSKDKLDIALLPQGETFATSRDAGPIPLSSSISHWIRSMSARSARRGSTLGMPVMPSAAAGREE